MAPLTLRIQNAVASVGVVFLSSACYGALPVHAEQLSRWHGPSEHAIQGRDFLLFATLAYALAVSAWMLADRHAEPSKSLRFVLVLWRVARAPVAAFQQGLTPADRVAVLATLLKGFFAPLMVMSMMGFCMAAWVNASAIWQAGMDHWYLSRELFDRFGFWFCMQVILFVDVLVFTVGYLVESRRLGNTIRSVDPTLVGWAAALLCYPPFNAITASILGAQVSDFPQFENTQVHLALNLLLLALMAVYASASLALGLKGSNLTHRGIVSKGPYRLVRHPAYVCKNFAWWIGAAPLVSAAFAVGWVDGLMSLASVLGWSLLYVLRALTEEDHLRSVDEEYAQYAARVRYRFLPGLV